MSAIVHSKLDSIISECFYSWREYKVILDRLNHVHGIKRSMTWLKLQLKRLGLKRRTPDPNMNTVKVIIRKLLRTSENLRGYRSIWKILRDRYKVIVRRDVVMALLKELDEEGVETRKKKSLKRRIYTSKGPNFVWHMDGYDKLSSFGITIHGCIDGFSRKILWLKVSPTNHNPHVVARHYLNCVEEIAGVPMHLRSDYGTENCLVASLQIAFHLRNKSGLRDRSYIYGPSKRNVKIEGWWSQLKRSKTSWWINCLYDMKDQGLFDGSNFHKKVLAYCIVHIIERELTEFQKDWNSHKIRHNSKTCLPSGIPNDLFEMPQAYGSYEDQLHYACAEVWVAGMRFHSLSTPPFYPNNFKLKCDQLIQYFYGISSQSQITTENFQSIYCFIVQNY